MSEIEITDSDALLIAPMGIERTRRERDHGAVCQFHHVDSLSFLNPRYKYQWNKPQSKCRKKMEELKTPQFVSAKIPTQMTPRCIQPTGILYARRYLRPNSADATRDRAPVILRKGPEAVSTSVALGARALKIPVKRRCDKFSKAEEEFVIQMLVQ